MQIAQHNCYWESLEENIGFALIYSIISIIHVFSKYVFSCSCLDPLKIDFISWTIKNSEVPAANTLGFHFNFRERVYVVQKHNCLITEPSDTPASTLAQESILARLPELLFCFNLRGGPSCHTLSHALEILRKKLLVSKPPWKDWWIFYGLDNTYFIYELFSLNLDWCEEIRLIFKKSYNICYKFKFQSFKNLSMNKE